MIEDICRLRGEEGFLGPHLEATCILAIADKAEKTIPLNNVESFVSLVELPPTYRAVTQSSESRRVSEYADDSVVKQCIFRQLERNMEIRSGKKDIIRLLSRGFSWNRPFASR